MKLLFKIYGIAVLVFVFSCKNKEAATTENIGGDSAHHHENIIELTAEQAKNAGIQTGKIEMRNIGGAIQASGMLDVPPQNLVSVSTPLGGFLSTTELLQGMRVKKGQTIAVLKSEEYIKLQQEFLETASQLVYLKAEYKRQETLAKDAINAQKTLQQANAEYLSAQARYDGLKARLRMAGTDITRLEKDGIKENLIITSPINGYVTQVHASLGAFISPGNEMFRIVDTDHLHAEIRIFERDLAKIKTNTLVYFTIAHETKQRKAHVYLLGREIEADRTVRIHCHLDNEDPELLPGMYITATIETHGALATALPNEAVVNYEGKNYIFIDKGSITENNEKVTKYEMVEIAIGSSQAGYTEVILPKEINSAASAIVIKGAYQLLAKKFNSEEGEHGH